MTSRPAISSPLPSRPWYLALGHRIATLWLVKMIGTTVGISGFFVVYFWVMHHPPSEPTVMPLTRLDHWVGVSDDAMVLYGSLWFYISLAPAFAKDKAELWACARALARRPAVRANFIMTLGQLSFDHHMRQAQVGDLNLTLPRRELLVLEALLEHRGRTVLRETMQDRVYGHKDEIQSNALDTHVSRLRSKLDKAGAQVEIHAIRGVGYLICAATPSNNG